MIYTAHRPLGNPCVIIRQVARDEVASFAEYDYIVLNDEVTAAVERLRGIVIAERARLARTRGQAQRIVRTFS